VTWAPSFFHPVQPVLVAAFSVASCFYHVLALVEIDIVLAVASAVRAKIDFKFARDSCIESARMTSTEIKDNLPWGVERVFPPSREHKTPVACRIVLCSPSEHKSEAERNAVAQHVLEILVQGKSSLCCWLCCVPCFIPPHGCRIRAGRQE
jgi:hypothetical protein